MTVADMLLHFRKQLLQNYDAHEAKAITNLVFGEVLQLNPLKLEMNRYRLLTVQQQQNLESILQRLHQFEPVQYVLGKAHFLEMQLNVNYSTLIPRPETEELVRWAAEKCGNDFNGLILDIGTGSGCIAIGLKKLLPKAHVAACDVSENALKTAILNAQQQNKEVEFFLCDVMQHIPSNKSFDVVVSNPPYIPLAEKYLMEKNVVDFEPHLALFTPNDNSLIFYERIAEHCRNGLLKKEGKIFFEVHFQKAAKVFEILKSKGFQEIELKKDFFGKERMVSAKS